MHIKHVLTTSDAVAEIQDGGPHRTWFRSSSLSEILPKKKLEKHAFPMHVFPQSGMKNGQKHVYPMAFTQDFTVQETGMMHFKCDQMSDLGIKL